MPDVKVEPKRVVFAFVFAAYLLIQIYLPSRCVVDRTYCRVGWTMMSRHLDSPAFFVRRASGQEVPLEKIDPDRTLVHLERRSIGARFIVRHVCEQIPDTVSVRVIFEGPRREEVTPCD